MLSFNESNQSVNIVTVVTFIIRYIKVPFCNALSIHHKNYHNRVFVKLMDIPIFLLFQVTLPDGSKHKGVVEDLDVELDLAIIKCDFPVSQQLCSYLF